MISLKSNNDCDILINSVHSYSNICIPNILEHSLLIVTFIPPSDGCQVRAGEVRGARRGAGRPPVAAVQPPVRPLRRHPHALQPALVPRRRHRGLGCSLCPNYLNFFMSQ